MPRKCVICKAYDKNNENSFYSFPKDEGRKKLWLKACGIKRYLPSYRVCEAHFSDKDFFPSGYLKSIAKPRNNSIKPELSVFTNTDNKDFLPSSHLKLATLPGGILSEPEPKVSTNTDNKDFLPSDHLKLAALPGDILSEPQSKVSTNTDNKDFLPSSHLKFALLGDILSEPKVSTNTVFDSSHQETLSLDTFMLSTNSICVTQKNEVLMNCLMRVQGKIRKDIIQIQ